MTASPGAGIGGLPAGFTVRLSRRTRVAEAGRVLIGGAPTRVTRLTPDAVAMFDGRELVVRDAASRTLAEHIVRSGLGDPVADALPAIPVSELTVVVPVKDRAPALARLLASLPAGVGGVIVVDDGSDRPHAVAAAAAAAGAALVVLPVNRGAAAARNEGLRRVPTPFVAFIDSDAAVTPGSLETLLRHFADPTLALIAPRIVGLEVARPSAITRYEDARSSLDLGDESAGVRPRSRVTWVSSTCLVGRVELLADGFDAGMRVGEDVDLVWRLVDAGHRVRFEPAAIVRHEHRTGVRSWLGRKFFYGTGAHPLAVRHPHDVAPVVLPPWAVAMLAALLVQRRWSVPVTVAIAVTVSVRIARRIRHVRHPHLEAARLTGTGVVAATAQGIALLVRHWWPLAVTGSLLSRRVRRATLVAMVADAVWEYARLRPRLDPLRFAVARRLDDLAYGAGVWWSSLRGRSMRALLPRIVRTSRRGHRPPE